MHIQSSRKPHSQEAGQMVKGVGEEREGHSPCPYRDDVEAFLHRMVSRSSQSAGCPLKR